MQDANETRLSEAFRVDNASALTRGMAGLSRSFYETAYDLTAAMALDRDVSRIKHPSAVVILTTACLEAYLGEVLALLREMRPQDRSAIAQLDWKDPKTRWLGAPLISGAATFDAGREPFQSFHSLLALRNALVHYSPHFGTPQDFPSKKIKALRTKFAFSYEGNADWTTQVLNLDCARWACKTTKAMVKEFHRLAGGTDMSEWPYPWPNPP